MIFGRDLVSCDDFDDCHDKIVVVGIGSDGMHQAYNYNSGNNRHRCFACIGQESRLIEEQDHASSCLVVTLTQAIIFLKNHTFNQKKKSFKT